MITNDGPDDRRPLVSVVLPVFNGKRYLKEALEGVLAQSYPAWELIVVDDASTDSTPQIIAEYAARDPRIRSYRNPANRRLPASLNAGFGHARGAYLTWTSDDNVFRADALAEMVAVLRDRPDVDLVYTDLTMIDEAGRAKTAWRAGEPHELAYRNSVWACFLYRRAVHEKLGGYSEELVLVEDWDFWQRASEQFRLEPLHRDLYMYREHPGSLTQQRTRQVYEATVKMLGQNLPRMRWVGRGERGRGYLVMAALSRYNGRRLAALRYAARSLFLSPRYTIVRTLRAMFGMQPTA